jgi:uncharacterized protein YegP (UPF0339 family)
MSAVEGLRRPQAYDGRPARWISGETEAGPVPNTSITPPTYYIRKSTTSRQPYFWNVIASNGEELARSSEMYENKTDAIHSANLVRQTSDNPFKDLTGDK